MGRTKKHTGVPSHTYDGASGTNYILPQPSTGTNTSLLDLLGSIREPRLDEQRQRILRAATSSPEIWRATDDPESVVPVPI